MQSDCEFEELQRAIRSAFIGGEEELSSSLEPALLFNDKNERIKVVDAIKEELSHSLSFRFSIAFITKGGLQLLKETFRSLKDKGITGQILTTDYLSFTDPEALLDLKTNFPNIEVRMYKTLSQSEDGFHIKGYIFEQPGERTSIYKAIIGSSNLTDAALTTNKEWNTYLSSTKDGRFMQEVLSQFDVLWKKASRLDDYIEQYQLIYEKQKMLRDKAPSLAEEAPLSPNPMQIAFTKNLLESLDRGDKRGLLISATGTGKTYASAFAIREVNPKKVLFLAHRSLLLRQAASSYRRIFGNGKVMQFLSGENDKEEVIKNMDRIDFLFSTSETMGKEAILRRFDPSAFDFIVIDEVHRAASPTYRRILNHFTPRFVLGMSATPERTEDASAIYDLFEHNVLYEIRLKDALELNLLCPFHYYGITDLKGINDETYQKSDFNLLYSDERISYIIRESSFYGYDGDRLKGLIFVSKRQDGETLSEKLNERGLKTVFLSSANSTKEREEAIERLEKDDVRDGDYLDYILTVDIFNEGVDIPAINQVLLLRPTESSIVFVQQLGRGLRKAAKKNYVVIIDFIGNYDSNFMIPKAFSYNGDKEAARSLLINGGALPGASSIEFDEIAKNRIFASIQKASFNTKKEFETVLLNLVNKINRIPTYEDFLAFTDFEPDRIINKYGSYYAFLKTLENKLPKSVRLPSFDPFELSILKAIGTNLGGGIRIEEPLYLLSSIEGKNKKDFEDILFHKYRKIPSEPQWNCMKKILLGRWDSQNGVALINEDGTLEASFANALLRNESFREETISLLHYLLSRYERFYSVPYKDLDLSLYSQYTYRDVCQALNYGSNLTSVIGGYKYHRDTNTYPIFINYDKDPSLESTNYADKFLNERILSWESKKNRHLDSKDFYPILNAKETGTRILLFVRKANNDKDIDAKKFYFLGEMAPYGTAREVSRLASENGKTRQFSYVDIDFLLEKPVRKDIYDYLTASIKEESK